MKPMNTASLLVLAGVLFAGAMFIRLDTRPAPVPVDPSFRADVLPILAASGCAGCHGDDGGLSVLSVRALLTGGDNGSAVLPGNPDSSRLVQEIIANFPLGPRMPPEGPAVPRASVEVIRAWIAAGAKDN